MFLNLNAEMARRNLNSKKLARLVGMKYDTLLNKLAGKTEFTRAEMFAIKDAISEAFTIDFLFATESKQTSA